MKLLVKENALIASKQADVLSQPRQELVEQDLVQQDLVKQDLVKQDLDQIRRVPIKRDPIKQELRRRIYEALEAASNLAPGDRVEEIRFRLFAIQNYCAIVEKTFIVVEQKITCNQFNLGGSFHETASLFRGPNEDASVAICVTQRGSILHRNTCPWEIYKDEGDIHPPVRISPLEPVMLFS